MANIFSIITRFLWLNRRKHKRIPCQLKAHFLLVSKNLTHRGATTISDITIEGLCCNELFFCRNDEKSGIRKNALIDIHFNITDNSGKQHSFEVVAKVRSILKIKNRDETYRFGVKIVSFKNGSRKELKNCVNFLAEQQT